MVLKIFINYSVLLDVRVNIFIHNQKYVNFAAFANVVIFFRNFTEDVYILFYGLGSNLHLRFFTFTGKHNVKPAFITARFESNLQN